MSESHEFTLCDLEDDEATVGRCITGSVIADDWWAVSVQVDGKPTEKMARRACAIQVKVWLCGGQIEVAVYDYRRADAGDDPAICIKLPQKGGDDLEIEDNRKPLSNDAMNA